MQTLANLFSNNRRWAEEMTAENPRYFAMLAKQQKPEYLWIGCADSRVPANQVIGLMPGEVFVHRNVANLVNHTDFNCLSVLEYAVCVLKVKHVIVCGHYGCGGVQAALQDRELGLIDNWLRHIRDIRQKHVDELYAIDDPTERLNRLCELNVMEQVQNLCSTTIVQAAWHRGQDISIHGLIYDLNDGLLRDLGMSVCNPKEIDECYRLAAV